MKYIFSETHTLKARELIEKLGFRHIPLDRVSCIISKGTKTKRTVARIHTLGKAMQLGMNSQPFYVIELMELFFKQNEEEQTKTLIHELMHIPKNFGGGFRHHKPFVNKRTVEREFQKLKNPENI
jgi:predicted metallopeptidase